MSRYSDTHGRSVAKALSWRTIGTLATAVIVFVLTRRWALSLFVGGVEFFSKAILFWLHERVWDRVGFGRTEAPPSVVWFTGLPGSGKSSISRRVVSVLQGRGARVEHLDGDSVRRTFPETGFSRAEREMHVRRIGYLASKLEQHGVFVVASFVSPYSESRDFVRSLCKRFVEVHVSTPLAVCESRDTQGLYAKARRGDIANFTGVSDPYEDPLMPELVIDAATLSLDDAVAAVIRAVDNRSRPLYRSATPRGVRLT